MMKLEMSGHEVGVYLNPKRAQVTGIVFQALAANPEELGELRSLQAQLALNTSIHRVPGGWKGCEGAAPADRVVYRYSVGNREYLYFQFSDNQLYVGTGVMDLYP